MTRIVKAIKIKKSFNDLGCAVVGSVGYKEILKLRKEGVEEDFDVKEGTFAVMSGDIVFLSYEQDSDHIYTVTTKAMDKLRGEI